jgi:hypothetical protein
MAGYNNPSLAAFMYATADEYGLKWKTGEDQLYLLSVGPGLQRPRLPSKYFIKKAPLAQAIHSLSALVHETSMTAQHNLQALSQPRAPFQINTEIKGLERAILGGAPLLQYERIDPPLKAARLGKELELPLSKKQQRNLHRIDLGTR